ncbi:unnamed protein product [Periconia digitata]|uniref:Uncharacterized protein n=1 Tax=Periconia digitata TaxID=1303443 RepID=A0A9W4UJ31_9PLEO|nr:unnamed protein product [Periconia digitata]
MPALVQPEILRRAVEDPYAIAYEAMSLVARAKDSKKAKGGKKKVKVSGGAIAGIVIAIIIAIIVICIIVWLVKRNQKKKKPVTSH